MMRGVQFQYIITDSLFALGNMCWHISKFISHTSNESPDYLICLLIDNIQVLLLKQRVYSILQVNNSRVIRGFNFNTTA